MRMGSRRAISVALSLIMGLSPLTACSSGTGTEPSGSAEMSKEMEGERAEEPGLFRSLFDAEGSYVVSFTAEDLIYDDGAAPEAEIGEEEPEAEIGEEEAEIGEEEAELGEAEDAEAIDEAVSEDAAAKEEAVSADDAANAENATIDELTEDDVTVTYPYLPADTEGDPESREAEVTSVSVEDGMATVAFTDHDALENATVAYTIEVAPLHAHAVLEVEQPTQSLSSETEFVSSTSDASEVVVNLEGGEFAEGVDASMVELGGSFEGMQVESAEVDGTQLKLSLAGTPVIDEASAIYLDGLVTIAPEALDGGTVAVTTSVPVETPVASVESEGIQADGTTVTVPLLVAGMDSEGIEASDVSFGDNTNVVAVEPDGEGRLVATVEVADAEDSADAVAKLAEAEISVGEAVSAPGAISHATFKTQDWVAGNFDNDVAMLLKLEPVGGSFVDDIDPEMINLSADFDGAIVDQVNLEDDGTLNVMISMKADGIDANQLQLFGTVEMAEGAMIENWGDVAPATSVTDAYISDDSGRANDDWDIPHDYEGFVDFDVNFDEDASVSRAVGQLMNEYESAHKQRIALEKEAKETGDRVSKWKGLHDEMTAKDIKYDHYIAAMKGVTGFIGYFGGEDGEVVEKWLNGFGGILISIGTGTWWNIPANVCNVIKLLFPMKNTKKEVSIKDLLKALDYVQATVDFINDKLSEVSNKQLTNKIAELEKRLIKLNSATLRVNWYLENASNAVASAVGGQPDESHPADVSKKYLDCVYRTCMELEKKKVYGYQDYTTDTQYLKQCMDQVIGRLDEAKSDGSNSFMFQSDLETYDRLISSYFNWGPQGYNARKAFRDNVEARFKSAYITYALAVNMSEDPLMFETDTKTYENVLQAITALNPGKSVEETRNRKPGEGVKCETIGGTNVVVGFSSNSTKTIANKINLQDYLKKLNGKSIVEDLVSAGVMPEGWKPADNEIGIAFDPAKAPSEWRRNSGAFAKSHRDVTYVSKYLTWDGKLVEKDELLEDTGKKEGDGDYHKKYVLIFSIA